MRTEMMKEKEEKEREGGRMRGKDWG